MVVDCFIWNQQTYMHCLVMRWKMQSEATEQLSNPDQKQIALTVRSTEGFCSVHLQNYTKERLRLENGLPVTGKSDKANHGFGIRSMQLLAEKYGGELTFRQEGDIVNTYILLPLAPAET